MRVKYFLTIVLLLLAFSGTARYKQAKKHTKNTQWDIDQTFCNTLMGIVSYVASDFEGIRGGKIETISSETRYESLWKVTGVKTAAIVHDSGWRYEGVIYRDTSKKVFAGYYNEFAAHLDYCLPHSGYVLTSKINTDKHLEENPDLGYRYKTGVVGITLKADHSAITGMYTLTVFVTK